MGCRLTGNDQTGLWEIRISFPRPMLAIMGTGLRYCLMNSDKPRRRVMWMRQCAANRTPKKEPESVDLANSRSTYK
jgi:hypothetical protein